MSAIIDRIEIPLTAKQHKAIKKFYRDHMGSGAAMLAIQPVGPDYCQKSYDRAFLRCALCDAKLTKAINSILKKHREQRP